MKENGNQIWGMVKKWWIPAGIVAGISYYSFLNFENNKLVPPVKEKDRVQKLSSEFLIPIPSHPYYSLLKSSFHGESFVDQIIRENEYSFNRKSSDDFSFVSKFDCNSVASNNPIEDKQSQNIFSIDENRNLYLFGIYDGHVGPQCGDVLKEHLPFYISSRFRKAFEAGDVNGNKTAAMKKVLKESFIAADQDLMNAALDEHYGFESDLVNAAFTGAVTLVTCVLDDDIYVANTGDVRAVMGNVDNESGKVKAIELSTDHDMENEKEKQRIISSHPGEPEAELTRNNRVLGGLQPTRSFGDANYKFTFDQFQKLFYGIKSRKGEVPNIRIPMNYKSPPYVTAEPEITHFKITPNDRFIVMGSDGLWERLSNEQVVTYVQEFMTTPSLQDKYKNAASFLVRKALESKDIGKDPKTKSQFTKIYNIYKDRWLEYLLTVPPPLSRRVRDDITITVIYLGSSNKMRVVEEGGKGMEMIIEDIKKDEEKQRYPSKRNKQQHFQNKAKL